MKLNVETAIENLVNTTLENKTEREKHLFRESLRNLVRLARAEQILEIKTSVKKLTGEIISNAGRRKAKIDQLIEGPSDANQRELEFDQNNMKQPIMIPMTKGLGPDERQGH